MCRASGLIVAAVLFAALSTPATASQTQTHAQRKVLSKVAPIYPDVAKRIQLAGMVKLEVVVRPDGKVKSAKATGGSPVLIQSAIDAVQKWRFEPGPAETTETVQIVFELSN